MDITFGLVDTPRELSIEDVSGAESGGDAMKEQIKAQLASGEGLIELADNSGKQYLIQASKVAYVQVGAGSPRRVGFIA